MAQWIFCNLSLNIGQSNSERWTKRPIAVLALDCQLAWRVCPGPGREAKRFSNVSNKDVIDVIDVTWLRLKKSFSHKTWKKCLVCRRSSQWWPGWWHSPSKLSPARRNFGWAISLQETSIDIKQGWSPQEKWSINGGFYIPVWITRGYLLSTMLIMNLMALKAVGIIQVKSWTTARSPLLPVVNWNSLGLRMWRIIRFIQIDDLQWFRGLAFSNSTEAQRIYLHRVWK